MTASGNREGVRCTVLVVDDDPDIRSMMELMLAAEGFQVLSANDPAEALRLCGTPGVSFDLLLTDLIMPGMSGEDLARRIAAERPSLKVIYMSALHSDANPLPPGFLAKPFSSRELLKMVASVLGRGRSL